MGRATDRGLAAFFGSAASSVGDYRASRERDDAGKKAMFQKCVLSGNSPEACQQFVYGDEMQGAAGLQEEAASRAEREAFSERDAAKTKFARETAEKYTPTSLEGVQKAGLDLKGLMPINSAARSLSLAVLCGLRRERLRASGTAWPWCLD